MSDIYGRKIAQAAAKFCSETGEYLLINAECMRKIQRPSLVVNKAFLRDNGISMECIRDCIEQLEAFGDVDENVKDPAGVETYGGSYNTGMVITSKVNPKVNCVVTLNSGRDEAAHDLYLEWYYDVDGVTDQAKNQTSFIEDFNRLTSGKRWLTEGEASDAKWLYNMAYSDDLNRSDVREWIEASKKDGTFKSVVKKAMKLCLTTAAPTYMRLEKLIRK